jgi:outer membrane biogenesis lipoprotein LolB
MMRVVLISLSAMLLAACSETDQSQAAAVKKSDGKAWQGAKNGYVVKDWTPGDKTGWESQLRTRAQMQNEYVKVN